MGNYRKKGRRFFLGEGGSRLSERREIDRGRLNGKKAETAIATIFYIQSPSFGFQSEPCNPGTYYLLFQFSVHILSSMSCTLYKPMIRILTGWGLAL